MQTFDCLSCKPDQRGFTLIEVLVVLLIVSVLVGLTVARLPAFAQNADLDHEARRLELIMNMARTEAVLDSVEFGFQTTADGYEFLKYDDASGDWVLAESPFHSRQLPDGLKVTVNADRTDFKQLGKGLPPVLILSSGETTPIELILSSPGQREERILSTDGYAEFAWEEDE